MRANHFVFEPARSDLDEAVIGQFHVARFLVLWITLRRHSGTPLAAGPESILPDGGYGFRAPSLRSGPGTTTTIVRAAALATTVLLTVVTAGSVRAQDSVEAFYRGRQINLIVGYGPGGGYDLTARLLARHIGRYIPGNPSVAVQNMVGAGSLRAANYLYGAAPKDGTTFGVFGSDIPMIGLIGTHSSVQFDARRFVWLGSSSSFSNDAYVLIVRADAKSSSLAEARRPGGAPMVLGGTG